MASLADVLQHPQSDNMSWLNQDNDPTRGDAFYAGFENEEEDAFGYNAFAAEDGSRWQQWVHRFLKSEDKTSGRMDYSVLSVGVLTLGLILAVEVGRHRLDHMAQGRPYFTAVLENIYAELTTLGVVEFFVWLLQSYHTDMNKDKKDVFADIHFALFYTAILNAFQSVLLAFITTRVARRMWVQTEALELNHYVEVREEFERVQALLHKSRGEDNDLKGEGKAGSSTSSDDRGVSGQDEIAAAEEQTIRSKLTYHAEYVFEASWKGLRSMWRNLMDLIRRPHLTRQYNKLLMQVRFHELRVHFLQSYNLPPKLKVSDYLIRCELQVQIKLVHISAVAWLLLTASMNLLYYVLGIVGYFKESAMLVGTTLIFLYFCMLGIFLALALLLFNKMKSIFRTIMHRPDLWEIIPDDREDEQRAKAKEQMSLFWLGSPKLVITAIQFMNFGYAAGLSAVIIFWDTIDDGDVPMVWYLIGLALAYASFVGVASHVIPRYTLCTSLAQLVDKKRLNETVANYHLDEAKKQRQAEHYIHAYNAERPELAQTATDDSSQPGLSSKQLSVISSVSSNDDTSGQLKREELTIADLVGMDTDTLREAVPEETSTLSKRELRKERRRRMRSVSDGVALMASMKEEEKTEVGDWEDKPPPAVNRRDHFSRDEISARSLDQRRRDRRKSVSDGVAAMAAMDKTPGDTTPPRRSLDRVSSERIADLVKLDTGSLRDQLSLSERQQLEERQAMKRTGSGRRMKSTSDPNQMAQLVGSDDKPPLQKHGSQGGSGSGDVPRRTRRKTVSDGVQFMAGLTSTFNVFKSSAASDAVDQRDSPPVEVAISKSEDQIDDGDDDDNMSDIDDIPEVDVNRLNEFRRAKEERKEVDTIRQKLKRYYLSKRFPVISNVFGTMVVFFMLGSRVERFLHTQDIVPSDFISFDFNQRVTFWIFSSMLFLFLVTDGLVFWTVDRLAAGRRYRVVWLASFMDAILVSVVWVLFWVAEGKRCCHSSENSSSRLLADDSDPHPCDCPTFGSRLWSGLGTIEPWCSLIALRIFRFYFAKTLIKRQDKKRGIAPTAAEMKAEMDDENNLDPFNVHNIPKSDGGTTATHDNHSHIHGGGHGHDDDHGHGQERGTATELWEMAVGQHPEVAEKYGMFSAEMLQVMLGLPLQEHSATPLSTPSPSEGSGVNPGELDPTRRGQRASFRVEKKYATLSVGAQEIIMQGKLGHSVQGVSAPDAAVTTIPEDDEVAQRKNNYVFEISDGHTVAPVVDLNQQLPFDTPGARLVRSMRRADRKLVPILNNWTPVDVVMTRFEIVYFDATDSLDGPELEATRQAMRATKGGKGLRLKDVAAGRKCVGHLLLTDITSLAVERYMPGSESHEHDEGAETEAVSVPETEFWKPETMHFSRKEAWSKIKQDTVAVHTSHGNTLYLRFYSDLEEAESHPERTEEEEEESGDLIKNNAFQWVQTLGRFCGPEQLHQDLPHFGEDNTEEIRDYLVVHKEGELKKNLMFLAQHGGNLRHHNEDTVGEMSKRVTERSSRRFTRTTAKMHNIFANEAIPEEDEGEEASAHGSGRGSNFFRRSQSLIEGAGETEISQHPAAKPGNRLFRRSHSTGEDAPRDKKTTKSQPELPSVQEASSTVSRFAADDSPV